jgi:hypothetical protein
LFAKTLNVEIIANLVSLAWAGKKGQFLSSRASQDAGISAHVFP